ncbi:Arm DNA-binding domain-containing protein [Solibacillus sp. FSL K6-1523]|uniref:Arm DNA-binding domain-containing protein n=1 Tax=Solibacillus sp. FSL K6-1523 TaxID=2921471 RepID=UPI0030F7490E
MFCEKIEKNMWRCIGEGPRNPTTGKRRQVTRRGKTKKEAERKILDRIAALQKQHSFSSDVCFAEFAGSWLSLYELKGNKVLINFYNYNL